MAKGRGGFIGQDGLNAPDSPTGVSGTAGNQQVTVSWTNPTDVGGSAITGYVISSTPSVPISPPSLSTASYTSKSFSLSGQGTYNYYGMTFNGDGTKAYFTGFGPDSILQYSLSTAFDISTASYDSVALDVSGQATAGQSGLVFSPDGLKIYMSAYTSNAVYQYTLSSAYDMSSGSYSNKSLTVSQDTNVQDVQIKSDGTKLFVLGDTNNSVFQYTMSTPFDLSSASYDNVSFVTTSQQTNCTGLFFSPDGKTMLICGYVPRAADKYVLSTPWDITTASHDSSLSVSGEFGSGSPNAIFAGNDLSNLFVCGTAGSGNGSIFQYAAGMPTASPFVYGGLTNGTSYTFNVWAINAFGYSASSDASTGVSPAAPNGLFAASGNSAIKSIDFIVIETLGNASDFGDVAVNKQDNTGCASSTRGIFAGGSILPSYAQINVIEYVTIVSKGDTTDFGDLTSSRSSLGGFSNETRGIFNNGSRANGSSNEIDYITIASTGNATDFGDSTVSGPQRTGSTASTTRGVMSGLSSYSNVIDYVTIGSTGNATDFGDLNANLAKTMALASSTRAVMGNGNDNQGDGGDIQYITIASTGNATDFGDMGRPASSSMGISNKIRGCIAGGSGRTTINYITIASTGNAQDFGNLTVARTGGGSCSSSHGGIA